VGWLVVDGDCFELPKFDRHNGESAKKRALSNVRKQVFRSRNADSVPGVERSERSNSVPREEKKREIQPPSEVASSGTPKRRSGTKPADSIRWSTASGWEGITDEDRAAWRVAYPACDIAGELARMAEWLKANPAKAHKSKWRAFVTSWLTRSQDRGGGQASTKSSTSQASKAWWRSDAGENMTDARYQAWRASRRPSGHAVSLAAAMKAP